MVVSKIPWKLQAVTKIVNGEVCFLEDKQYAF